MHEHFFRYIETEFNNYYIQVASGKDTTEKGQLELTLDWIGLDACIMQVKATGYPDTFQIFF